jgi:hypothetical protein
MTGFLARPSIFRARSVVVRDGESERLRAGHHLRVKVSPWLGFPLHPFAAWRLPMPPEPEGITKLQAKWRDGHGGPVEFLDDTHSVTVHDGQELFGTIQPQNKDDPWVWVQFRATPGLRIDVLDDTVVGTEPRILMTRSRPPYVFGDASLTSFRVTGPGTISGVEGRAASSFSREQAQGKPHQTFGLPFEIEADPAASFLAYANWYAPDRDPGPCRLSQALSRVHRGTSLRLNPPDDPTGSQPPVGSPSGWVSAEVERIRNLVAPQLVDPWLHDGFRDPNKAPVLAELRRPGPAPAKKPLHVTAPITPSLFTMAVDPQIARYLGLATVIEVDDVDPDKAWTKIEEVNVWLVASRWAVQLHRRVRMLDETVAGAFPGILNPGLASVPLGAFLDTAAPGGIDAALDAAFDMSWITGRLASVPFDPADGPWSIVTLAAYAVAPAGAIFDAPDAFQLTAQGPGTWNADRDPHHPGPDRWQQTISLGPRPARGMVGFVRTSPGPPVALHEFMPALGQPTARALPLVPNWASNHERVLTDRAIPPDPGGASWHVWQADEFGQWSAPAPLTLHQPPRPRPPAPVAELRYTALPDDGSSNQRVPGTIHLRLDVPDVAHSAPGALPIAQLHVTVDGVGQPPIAVSPGGHVERDFQPKPFGVGQQRQIPVVATFVDSGNQSSPAQTVNCGVYDARAPDVIKTSPVVIWAGQPDATGRAELALKWPPRAGAARYHVYLGDVRRLAGDSIHLPESDVRAAAAKPIHDRSSTFGDKHLFTFLGEAPAKVEGDNHVHYTTQIPGSLRGLQFVRIVPTSAGGAEAPFSDCGLVPVAVPGSDKPPPPAVGTTTDAAVGVTVTVRARGLRADLVAAGAGKRPQYRLRRTRRAATDRAYVPALPDGPKKLTGPDANGVWTASVPVLAADLDPFVRYRWFAEVRYPFEPPIPPDAAPEPVDGGVEPVWTSRGDPSPSVWSDLSLAAESLLIPPKPPQPPEAPTLTKQPDGSIQVEFAHLPVAAPDAIGPYLLELYHADPGRSPARLQSVPTTSADLTFTVPAGTPLTGSYLLVLVDPVGRRSKPTKVTPPA